MEELLRLENVCCAYGEDRPALRDFSLSVGAGERIAVVGSNGAGKSTLFLCCNGVLRPQSGTVFFEGRAVGSSRKELNRLRRGVGLVFQDPDVQLLAGTVEEEISFGPMNLGLPEEEVRDRVEEVLRRFSLEEFRRRAPHELSGGEKKRVTLADVMAMKPRLLLLDEPASSLDRLGSRQLEETLGSLSEEGLSVMAATHDMDFAWRWASRVLVIREGRLEADGTPREVFSDDGLLARCGLEPPALLRVGRLLRILPLPRTVEELERACNLPQNIL